MSFPRSSGILLHITSLSGKYGIGSLGNEAYRFIDFLCQSGIKYWQILPLGPVGDDFSPYQSVSAFAGNPLLINLDALYEKNWIAKSDLEQLRKKTPEKKSVQKRSVKKNIYAVLKQAFQRALLGLPENDEFYEFCSKNSSWLENYTLFVCIKKLLSGRSLNDFPEKLKHQDTTALAEVSVRLKNEILFEKFIQFLFFLDWRKLKSYANQKGIQIIGDIPIYVSSDSSDVWQYPELFMLDRELKPSLVGGVPPDYFNEEGQLWGNPVYNWEQMERSGFSWWLNRFSYSMAMFDVLRFDHFRGLSAYWAVGANESTAVNGQWLKAPGEKLLKLAFRKIPDLNLFAEDLGLIDEDVVHLRNKFHLMGMKVLQFAFDGSSDNPHLPENYDENTVVYTGTHDNDTSLGWFEKLEPDLKEVVKNSICCNKSDFIVKFIQTIWKSAAQIAIIPGQDLLGLGTRARLNTPGTIQNNWIWKLTENQMFTDVHSEFVKKLNQTYKR